MKTSMTPEYLKFLLGLWIPSHIGIRGNEAADVAAKESLDFNITPRQVPYTDLKPHINSFIANKWQERWSSCPIKSWIILWL